MKKLLQLEKRKKASINVAMDLVKNNQAEAVYSAGNSGAMMASAIFRIGRLKGLIDLLWEHYFQQEIRLDLY